MAQRVAAELQLPMPHAGALRPLADLEVLSESQSDKYEFYLALVRAAGEPLPSISPTLRQFSSISELRVFITSAVDRSLERALDPPAAVVAYSPSEPFNVDQLKDATRIVFHAAGLPNYLPYSVALQDADWYDFARSLTRIEPLMDLLHNCHLLVLGGGSPGGFVEFWLTHCSRRLDLSQRAWVGSSAFARDRNLARYLRGRHQFCRVFDDLGLESFVSALTGRWAAYKADSATAQPG